MTTLAAIISAFLIGNVNFKSLPIEESGANVNTVCQDSLGRIWLGGKDGIVRFDGNRYEHFSNNDKFSGHTPDNHVYNIICDSKGTIWVSDISGLSKYDSKTDSFSYYPTPGGSLSEIVELPSGDLLTNIGKELWIFNITDNKFSKELIPDTLLKLSVTTIAKDNDRIFVGTKHGQVFVCSSTLNDIKELNSDNLDNEITCILQDQDSHIWIGTESSGLWEGLLGNDSCCQFADTEGCNCGNTDVIKALCIAEDGKLWVGTKNGLKILNNGHLDTYQHDDSPGSLPHNSVGALFSDMQGTMWLGTYYGGVCYYTSTASAFKQIIPKSDNGHASGNIISDIVQDKDGSIWIGTNSSGLLKMFPNGRIINIPVSSDDDNQLDVKSIYISQYSGQIFIGADRSKLFTWDSKKNQLKELSADSPKSCYAMEYNNKDGFYIGTADGLYEYNERTRQFSRILYTGDNTNIKSLKLDSHGVLWIGKKNGLTALYTDGAKLLEIPESIASIKYAEIIIEDSNGTIWIGSRHGLHSYNTISGECTSYTEAEGLPHHAVHGIEEDANGILWVSTDRGLCRLNPKTGDKLTFTTSDGLLENRFTTYAHCKIQGGLLCFGGFNGIVIFDPNSISLDRKALPPVVSGIEINGVWNGVPEKKIVLKPNESSITFLFSSPDYISEKNGKFYYKLDKLETDWNMTSTDLKATYQNLPPGEYTFKIRYVNSSGKESDHVECINITIKEFWYKTRIAYVTYTLIILFIILGLIRYLVVRKERKFKYKMDEFRNKILRDFSLEFRNQNNTEVKAETPRNFDESDEKFMRRAMKIVRENMDNADFSVDDFAGKMFMSRSNLNIKVKTLFGVSPLELIKTVRFNEACRLLLEKKHTMTEISEMVGFSTSSYFTSAFKRFIGCTPSEYLKKNC